MLVLHAHGDDRHSEKHDMRTGRLKAAPMLSNEASCLNCCSGRAAPRQTLKSYRNSEARAAGYLRC